MVVLVVGCRSEADAAEVVYIVLSKDGSEKLTEIELLEHISWGHEELLYEAEKEDEG